MRTLRRTLLCLLSLWWLSGQTAAAVEPSTWPEFSPPQAGFSIRLPATPTEQVDPSTGATNYQVLEGEKSFVVSVAYLTREMRERPAREILENTKSGFLQLLPSSRLVRSEARNVGGFPASVCVIQSQAPGRPEFTLKMMAVVANTRLFNVGYISRADAFVEADVDKYIATFKLK